MEEDDNAWVFDSLVCFLNGPVWNAPLQSFIEEKSLIFEPTSEDNEEYLKVFEEFKNLVDFMLGNFMEDIGITPQQFEEACAQGMHQPIPVHFDQNLFEQIWAANDYEMFKRLMSQKNVELQLQALELIEQKYGITPQSFIPHKKDATENLEPTIKTSETEVMKEVVKNFPATVEPEATDVDYFLKEKKELKEKLEESRKVEVPKEMPATSTKTVVDSNELLKRQSYLRAQRDKLVAMKKEARKKQLNAENKEVSKARPKSAKAAEAVMTGDTSTIEPQQLQIRKALAERLKTEVVGNKEN